MKRNRLIWFLSVLLLLFVSAGCSCVQSAQETVPLPDYRASESASNKAENSAAEPESEPAIDSETESLPQPDPKEPDSSETFVIPKYLGEDVIPLNGNIPEFSVEETGTEEFLFFSDLDEFGRCGPAYGCIGNDLLAKEPRGAIGMIKPSGWHTARYDFIDGMYLYNRCHLIAYELCGVNADDRNLITGTRHLNVDGMLGIENSVFSYISNTGNHVLYRVSPRYEGENLLATGIQIEAFSVEDLGEGICLNVFCFNVQPGVVIDYSTGDSCSEIVSETRGDPNPETESSVFVPNEDATYILNTNTKRFHLVSCPSVQDMKEKNRREFFGTREELIEEGYVPCGRCNP